MDNPWNHIPLEAYEAHMSQASVGQLQTLDRMMDGQFRRTPARTAVIFGVAGGNGVRHLGPVRKVYGVDVNPEYLSACRRRLALLGGRFETVLADVTDPDCVLPEAELVIANLFVEYVGCAAFVRAVEKTGARWVSVGLQLDGGAGFVSPSPYAQVFEGLSAVHASMDPEVLTAALETAGFRSTGRLRYPLPNGKALLVLDFQREEAEFPVPQF